MSKPAASEPIGEHRTTLDFAGDLGKLTRSGFRVAQISPADDPSVALLVKDGHSIQLMAEGSDVQLRSVQAAPQMPKSQPEFELTRLADHPNFGDGRAGMAYRDLVPSRQGGRIIASHIHIADAGPVADYVHFHNICFQMIYVHSGWVRLVYEDQGEPFVASAGDCVLQPPHIRHQVLESSAGLEVVEVAAPAVHDTFADLKLQLPTASLNPTRDYRGQRYWMHEDSKANWQAGPYAGFETCDFGLGTATGGVAEVYVHRAESQARSFVTNIECESQLLVVLDGEIGVTYQDETHPMSAGDCVVIPGGQNHQLDSYGPCKVLAVDFVGLP